MDSTLIKAIRTLLEIKKLSQQELAVLINVDPTTLSKTLNGQIPAGKKILGGLTRIFPEMSLVVLEHLKSGKES